MKRSLIIALPIGLLVGAACATAMPVELIEARRAWQHAQRSDGARLVPDELHKARVALDRAENAFQNDPGAQSTRDYAYVAGRKAQLAEARGGIALAELDKRNAVEGQLAAQEQVTQKVRGELRSAEERAEDERRLRQQQSLSAQRARDQLDAERQLAARDRGALEKTTAQLDEAEKARRDAEARAAQAMTDLEKLAAVKQDERGLVITLSGSVLFATGQWALLPDSRARLDQVATALAARPEKIVVEGHTDNRGGDSYNLDLSERRAHAVRDYLMTRGVSPARCTAVGYGESRPIADNRSAEGRANNRRVEIVVRRDVATR